jgi:hypothetical protein
MKKIYYYSVYSLLFAFFLISCKPEPEIPHAAQATISPGVPGIDQLEVGDTILFLNKSTYSDHYHWDFGDGATNNSNSPSILHTYNASGTFKTTLIAYNNDGKTDQTFSIHYIFPVTGKSCFWFASSATYQHTVVTIGTARDTIKIATGLPGYCGFTGCANFQLSPGNYNYSAAELAPGTHTWSGSISITKHCCVMQQLL